MRRVIAGVTLLLPMVLLFPAMSIATEGYIDADAESAAPTTLPVTTVASPVCWWVEVDATPGDRSDREAFWASVDGGAMADDVVVVLKGGVLFQTVSSERRTTVWKEKVCDPETTPGAGTRMWRDASAPVPEEYWDALTERVVKRVPAPVPDLGYAEGRTVWSMS